jgi:hypothetical protein
LYTRQRIFEVFFLLALIRGVTSLLPSSFILGTALVFGPRPLHSYSAAALFFSVVALLVCAVIRGLRIPVSCHSEGTKSRRHVVPSSNASSSSFEIAV